MEHYLTEEGQVKFYTHLVTNKKDFKYYCRSFTEARNIKRNPRFFEHGNLIIEELKEPDDNISQSLKGIRFDTSEDAELFVNGGYRDSMQNRIADVEAAISKLLFGSKGVN